MPMGMSIAMISDGLSNTAMFAEVMRGTKNHNDTNQYDNTTVLFASISAALLGDGRTQSKCAGGTISGAADSWSWGRHVGHQYYRGDVPTSSQYSHTLPPNWNRLANDQKYGCGDSGRYVHIPASSYHTGGVNVCLADGSVKFVSDSVDFALWQAVGSRANSDIVSGDF
jgi:prepilin-type processing-associated H-X9-DG protein